MIRTILTAERSHCAPTSPQAQLKRLILAGLALALLGAPTAHAGIAGLTRVANGLSLPIFTTHAPGDKTRQFIVERGGGIRILNLTTGNLEGAPFLTVDGIDSQGEGGLLGLAFHPDYANNGLFYTYQTRDLANGSPFNTQIREWHRSNGNANIADAASTKLLMSFARPADNHVGGWIGFDPTSTDPYLYIASGDGGGDDDNDAGHTAGTGNAQDYTDNWFGKMLRINVEGDAFAAADRNYTIPLSNPFTAEDPFSAPDDEIWHYGLRNPFRDSFDRATGDMWIGDVGQNRYEEINLQEAGEAGLNFGWRLREGDDATQSGSVGGPLPLGARDPAYFYDRDNDSLGGTVVTGGYVYRGPDPTLQGRYFFLDSRNTASSTDDNYWMLDSANPGSSVQNIDALLTPNTGTVQFPVSMGEDAIGNLYVVYIISGAVYRINTNAFRTGDFDGDADVDGDDLTIWRTNFGMATGATRTVGDANNDGAVDGDDFLAWQRNVGWSAIGSAVAAGAPVPEPAGAALMAVAAFALVRRRRAAHARVGN